MEVRLLFILPKMMDQDNKSSKKSEKLPTIDSQNMIQIFEKCTTICSFWLGKTVNNIYYYEKDIIFLLYVGMLL